MSPLFFAIIFLSADPLPENELDVPSDWDKPTAVLLQAYAKKAEERRKSETALLQNAFVAATKLKTKNASDKKEKAELVKSRARDLLLMRSGATFPDVAIDIASPKTGDIGRLRKVGFDRTLFNLKLDPYYAEQVTVTVSQIVDGKLFVTGPNGEIVLVGMETKDIADGSKIELTQIFYCVGPKPYTSTDGSKLTLFTFEVFPEAKLREWEGLRIKAVEDSVKSSAKK
jgi:hypothetical protein